MRVHELSKDLNIPCKELLTILEKLQIPAKKSINNLNEAEILKIREYFAKLQQKDANDNKTTSIELPKQKNIEKEILTLEEKTSSEQTKQENPSEMLKKPTSNQNLAQVDSHLHKKEEKIPNPKKDQQETKSIQDKKNISVPSFQLQVPKHDKKEKPKHLVIKGHIVVREFAEQLGLRPNQLISELMSLNVFASINQRLDIKVAQQIAERHGFILEYEKKAPEHKQIVQKPIETEEEIDRPEDLEPRPPIVTFMGHIDHGKTSLLDKIRNSSVAKNEAGNITQHIGAYTVEKNGKKITFLDTPGHAAFTAMRSRGANITDIVVLVVAADDGVMPQTIEAIKHAQAAKTTIMVAINKIDLPTANPERVKSQLQSLGLVPEEWGGDIICCPVSALTGKGIDNLLEMILLQAEMLELKANPKARASGYVLEAKLEAGSGPVAHLIIMRGTLSVGDAILCGCYWGRVRALIDDRGLKVRSTGPGMAVKCLGLSGVPQAGEKFKVCPNEKIAREIAQKKSEEQRLMMFNVPRKASLETLFQQSQQQQKLELRIILKCDTQGSVEAIQKLLEDLKNEKVSLSIILSGVGNVTENDVLLASASNAIIIGFNVQKDSDAITTAKKEGVEIRLYKIIYDIYDDIKEAMQGMLKPQAKEHILGQAEIKQVFPIAKKGKIAGCIITSGKVTNNARVRVKRNNDVIYEGSILTLKRYQDEVTEVKEGQECGIRLDNYTDFAPGDILEFYVIEKITQQL